MKTAISLLSTTICILLTLSCTPSSKDQKTQLVISCTECAGMDVSLKRSDILPNGPKEIYESKFDSLGLAKIEFVLNDTTRLSLVIGNRDSSDWKFSTSLYFEPQKSIHLALENGATKFEGDLKKVNTYYSKIFLIEKERQSYVNANFKKYLSGSSLERRVILDSLTQFGTALKSEIQKDKSISDHYRKMLLSYNSLFEITQRMYFETLLARRETSEKGMSTVLDSTLSNAFSDLTIHRDYIDDPGYIWCLSNRLLPLFDDLLNYRYDNKIKTGEYEYIKGAIEKAPKLDDYREYMMALFLVHMSGGFLMDYDRQTKLIDLFRKDYPNSKYLTGLNYILASYAGLTNGMPMKDLVMQDSSGKEFKLSDLKGNLIYIDVWATWCGPCREELKNAPQLSKKYAKHADLKFVYVSIDDNTEAWRKFVKKNPQIKGTHGVQNTGFLPDSALVTALYKFNGIPRYILIDKKGNIITPDAKRPSELVVSNYLDSLLAL